MQKYSEVWDSEFKRHVLAQGGRFDRLGGGVAGKGSYLHRVKSLRSFFNTTFSRNDGLSSSKQNLS